MNLNKTEDEYVWKNYTPEYSNQLKGMVKNEGFDFFVRDWSMGGDRLLFNDVLVDNWKELYSIIHRLNPESVFEFGCGACYHLRNIMTVCPHIPVSGADYLQSQIDFGKEFFPADLAFPQNVSQRDLTEDVSHLPQHDLVFSQAVVMHLSSDKAVKMLKNMGKMSKKWIVMVEGVRNHVDWYDLVRYALPEYSMQITEGYIDYGVILTKNA